MKKMSSGFTLVELLVVIGILGILMGALFPAINAAMLTANTNAMAVRGRNLYMGITQANIDRQQRGLESVWPKAGEQKSDDQDDIAGMDFSDSAKFFEELFDIKNYGTEQCSPYVSGMDLSVLSGSGVPTFTGGSSLNGKYVAWIVAKGLTDEMEDVIPALVTRNVEYSKLQTATADMSQDKNPIGIGKINGGESDTPFGNKAFVVIRKGGAADVVKAKYAKMNLVYNRQSIVIPTTTTFEYLKTGCGE